MGFFVMCLAVGLYASRQTLAADWPLHRPMKNAQEARPFMTSVSPRAVLYGHIHIAKTAGSYVNGALALNYERVCGTKGYSYDAFQANRRYKLNPGEEKGSTKDSISKAFPYFHRQRVPRSVMDEIGYEDCDLISREGSWTFWEVFATWPAKVELHLPCREPIDHILSQCNFRHQTLTCKNDILWQVKRCLVRQDRFSYNLTSSDRFRNVKLKCFDSTQAAKYISYMGTKLQKKRFQSSYKYRPTNTPRNKSAECLLSNETARNAVEAYLITLDYYKFCNYCLGSADDLLRGG